MQIWKTSRKSGKRGADLEIAMQICKVPCKFTILRQKNAATRGLNEYRDSREEGAGELFKCGRFKQFGHLLEGTARRIADPLSLFKP
jgi:hypothetical protein